MDWHALREACLGDARAQGVSEEDAQDIAQEAIARTIEQAAVESVQTYARLVARRLASSQARGYTSKHSPGRGITRPLPTSIAYTEDRGPPTLAQWQSGIMPTCQLMRHGLSCEPEQESSAIVREQLERLDQVLGGSSATVAEGDGTLEQLARLEEVFERVDRIERESGNAGAGRTSIASVGRARTARHRLRKSASRALAEPPQF